MSQRVQIRTSSNHPRKGRLFGKHSDHFTWPFPDSQARTDSLTNTASKFPDSKSLQSAKLVMVRDVVVGKIMLLGCCHDHLFSVEAQLSIISPRVFQVTNIARPPTKLSWPTNPSKSPPSASLHAVVASSTVPDSFMS